MPKLNAGCGKRLLPASDGWVNLDKEKLEGVDLMLDLERPLEDLAWYDNYFDEIFLSHTFEHFKEPLIAMENLWRMAKADAKMTVRCPWGGSHIAFEDPTHVRAVFLQTMHYFSQTAYNAADYGYRGDWETERQIVVIDSQLIARDAPVEVLHQLVLTQWNVAKEIICELKAIKPARAPGTPSRGFRLEFAFDDEVYRQADQTQGRA